MVERSELPPALYSLSENPASISSILSMTTGRSWIFNLSAGILRILHEDFMKRIGTVARNASRDIFGRISLSRSSLFPASSGIILDIPVMFPPGCARLATKPLRTGSPTPIITIGIVVVAFLAAWTTGVARTTMMIDFQPDQLLGQLRKILHLACGSTVFDSDVSSLIVAQVAQTLQKDQLKRIGTGNQCQEPDLRDFFRLLRLGSKAKRKEYGAKSKGRNIFLSQVFFSVWIHLTLAPFSLDHPVRSRQQIWWNRQADLLGRFEINHQLKF